MSRRAKYITEPEVLAVASRLAAGIPKRTIGKELGITLYYINKVIEHPSFSTYFKQSLRAIAEILTGKYPT